MMLYKITSIVKYVIYLPINMSAVSSWRIKLA